jgi:hypothetical protein
VASVTALAPSTGHLALRPVAQRIGRLPAAPDSEVETTYQFRAVTRAADEAHIRTLLVRELTGDDFVLHSVQSHDLNGGSGLVEVTAELQRHGRDDLALETAVSRPVGRAGTAPAVRPIDPFDPAGPICVVDSGLVVDPVYSNTPDQPRNPYRPR